ncbi:MAG TPA: SDR family NAD(P)-dependent oxidoreductase [Thermoleophilaceae bacterium]|jgi:NAD(P)-dependent dehydrogenase (short-subunit alcohol dehydrogenase family)|nr:SDR family NAD(P)-dependent oxidoreductase [Thermoleophilaceae bacterium]
MAHVTGAALVVGGASGIGRACAEALGGDGWAVAVADLRPDADHSENIAVDVRDRDAVRAGVDSVAARHGALGAVVYAAGTARVTPLLEIDPAEWDLVTAVNLTGAFNVLQAAAPHLVRGGSFTLISSVDSSGPVAGLSHYSAAKAGGEALMRAAALELGGRGIRCNSVLPGVVRTPLMAETLDRPGITEAFLEHIPLGRIAAGGDIAGVVAFLASSAAGWITGVSLPVDGGMSLREHPALLDGAEPTRKDYA